MTEPASPHITRTYRRTDQEQAALAPIRVQQRQLPGENWREFHESAPGPPRFRLQRESEVPRLVAAMDPGRSSSPATAPPGSARPDKLAGERQERRQIVAIARMVCQATTEVLNGARPASQLRKWLEAEVHHKVAQRAAIMARHRPRESVRPQKLHFDSERTTHASTGSWEVAVVFTDEHRTHACAMRLQAHRGRWRVVALELG